MDLERRSSGTAKAGLATGIVGTALGTLGVLGSGANTIGNMFGRNNYVDGWGSWGPQVIPVAVPMNMGGCFDNGFGYGRNGGNGCCSENMLVNRYELELQQQIAEKDAAIALRDANTYNDQKSLEMYKYIDGRLRDIEAQLCKQEVENQATRDSFQLVRQENNCCCDKLNTAIATEANERRCADNTIVTYANATFYPKQVADITTGTTSVAQATYNPLPCNCNCGRNS